MARQDLQVMRGLGMIIDRGQALGRTRRMTDEMCVVECIGRSERRGRM